MTEQKTEGLGIDHANRSLAIPYYLLQLKRIE